MLSEVEIAGEFVRRFYDYWRTDADRLYCFYDAASVVSNAFFSVAGRASVKHALKAHATQLGLGLPVHVRRIAAQPSLQGGILVHVVAYFEYPDAAVRHFQHCFVLAQHAPDAYFVLNDILAFIDHDDVVSPTHHLNTPSSVVGRKPSDVQSTAFLSGLPADATTDSIAALFDPAPISIELIPTKKYAYVKFDSPQVMKHAVQNKQAYILNGHKLNIDERRLFDSSTRRNSLSSSTGGGSIKKVGGLSGAGAADRRVSMRPVLRASK